MPGSRHSGNTAASEELKMLRRLASVTEPGTRLPTYTSRWVLLVAAVAFSTCEGR